MREYSNVDMGDMRSAGYLGEKIRLDSISNIRDYKKVYLFADHGEGVGTEFAFRWETTINFSYIYQDVGDEFNSNNIANHNKIQRFIDHFSELPETIDGLEIGTHSDKLANYVFISQKHLVRKTTEQVYNVYSRFLGDQGYELLNHYIKIGRKCFSIVNVGNNHDINRVIIGIDLDLPADVVDVCLYREVAISLGLAGGGELKGYDVGIESIFRDSDFKANWSSADIEVLKCLYATNSKEERSYNSMIGPE